MAIENQARRTRGMARTVAVQKLRVRGLDYVAGRGWYVLKSLETEIPEKAAQTLIGMGLCVAAEGGVGGDGGPDGVPAVVSPGGAAPQRPVGKTVVYPEEE